MACDGVLNEGDERWPRGTCIRAVAGQPPRGYERAVLDTAELPDEFTSGVEAVEQDRATRYRKIQEMRGTNARNLVPRLADGVTVVRKPVLGEGEFFMGNVLVTPHNTIGTPCSAFVSRLIASVDGKRSVEEILGRLSTANPDMADEQVASNAMATLQILYADGTIDRYSNS